MRVNITEYLTIDLDKELWECRVCAQSLGNARDNYKKGLLVCDRKLSEVHPHLLDPEKYEYTFCPDPNFTALIEYYCPSCGTMVETEYTVPGHPLVHDIELDIDDLKKKAAQWGEPGQAEIPEWNMPKSGHSH
mgnify:FL=1